MFIPLFLAPMSLWSCNVFWMCIYFLLSYSINYSMNLMYAKAGFELGSPLLKWNALSPELLSLQNLSMLWKRCYWKLCFKFVLSTLATVGFSCTKKQTVIHWAREFIMLHCLITMWQCGFSGCLDFEVK